MGTHLGPKYMLHSYMEPSGTWADAEVVLEYTSCFKEMVGSQNKGTPI